MSELTPIPLLSAEEIRKRKYELFGILSDHKDTVISSTIDISELPTQEYVECSTSCKNIVVADQVDQTDQTLSSVNENQTDQADQALSHIETQIESQRLQDKLNAIDEYYDKMKNDAKKQLINTNKLRDIDLNNTTSNTIMAVMPTCTDISNITNTLNSKVTENQLRCMMNSMIIDNNYENDNDKLMLKSLYCDNFETDELLAFLDPNVKEYHIKCPNPYY